MLGGWPCGGAAALRRQALTTPACLRQQYGVTDEACSASMQCQPLCLAAGQVELPRRLHFADLIAIVSVAYESTVLGAAADAVEQLPMFVYVLSVLALRRASTAGRARCASATPA